MYVPEDPDDNPMWWYNDDFFKPDEVLLPCYEIALPVDHLP